VVWLWGIVVDFAAWRENPLWFFTAWLEKPLRRCFLAALREKPLRFFAAWRETSFAPFRELNML
jgi:hypothetical protein